MVRNVTNFCQSRWSVRGCAKAVFGFLVLFGVSCLDGRPGSVQGQARTGPQGRGSMSLSVADSPADPGVEAQSLCVSALSAVVLPMASDSVADVAPVNWCVPKRPDRRGVRFSFAIISDTHSYHACRVGQGPRLRDAIGVLNTWRPDFVLGLGDLIAGGGDCGRWVAPNKAPAQDQLLELRRVLLEQLKVPIVPVSGNHDLTPADSLDRKEPTRAWTAFWRTHRRYLLPAVRRADASESFRFTHKGVSFALISAYGSTGLKSRELRWIRDHVQAGDLVFRHVNPFGVSCGNGSDCGCGVGHQKLRRPRQVVKLLKAKGVRTLFSGHTHAFYHGVCNGLSFVNTGSLGERSMEFLQGWHNSPYRQKQAFVWVDVMRTGKIRITFHVWNDSCACFRPFDPSHFPAVIKTWPRPRFGQYEGVTATCHAVRTRP
jgi:Calcineurin-like phosphoesterase